MEQDDLIAELRKLLQELITPDLASLMAKLEEIQGQMRMSEQTILEGLATFRAEAEILRAETAASHAEMMAKLEALRSQLDGQIEERPVGTKPNRFLM